MATSSISWMPSQGRHPVNIGPSLSRAVKARKQKDSPAPPTKKSNLPERDFYAFRYNFKSNSIDSTKPAAIETKRVADNTQVVAEFPNKEGDITTYNGSEQPSKEIDCVLIYDEDTGQYSLEKLDAFVSLQFGGKKSVPTLIAAIADKGKRKQEEEDDDLTGILLKELDDKELPDPLSTTKYSLIEEIEEGEEPEIPLRQPSPLPPPKLPPPSLADSPYRSTKPLPRPRAKAPILDKATPTAASIGPASLPAKPAASNIITPATTAVPPRPASKPKEKKVKLATNSLALPGEIVELPKGGATKKGKSSTSTAGPTRQSKVTKTLSTFALPDEEILELPKVAAPAKPNPRANTAGTASRQLNAVPPPAPPKAPTVLSLPGAGDSHFALPGSLPSSSVISTSAAAGASSLPPISTPAVPPGVSAKIVMEEYVPGEEDDITTRLEDEIFGDFGEEEHDDENEDMVEQEIDADLEAELEQEINFGMTNEVFGGEDSDDDEDMEDAMEDAMQEVPTIGDVGGEHIIPWNKMPVAGEADSEEEYSTSDSDSD
ncbi:RNA polymerase II transcription elongation factor-domain-containing protein [Crepidotus variabilis]|uniref:RNA polymerase II transcription elongation factor-domain-containing protein n=1 Tax=Crepidotus variabilis TaxID=179855 RepID=A0A9P6ED98_9AGAR|nr:RNA polymerase II transcription elongation factor-domain-containing protein [Crepidotus variabilis]